MRFGSMLALKALFKRRSVLKANEATILLKTKTEYQLIFCVILVSQNYFGKT